MKKLSFFAVLILMATALGCADGKSGDRNWKVNDSCEQKDLEYNGTLCQGKNIIRCENNKISIQSCNDVCIIDNNTAVCKGSNSKPSRTDTDDSRTESDTPSGSSGTRPETGHPTNPPKEPNTGDDCGQYDSKGVCNNQTSTIILCDPTTHKIKKTQCSNGCLLGSDKQAFCQEPCGTVTETGVCTKDNNKDILKYCYKTGSKETLVVEECQYGCDLVEGSNSCLKNPASSTTEERCDDNADSSCNYQTKTITYCENNKIVHKKCDNGCMYDGEKKAHCIQPCNGVTDEGICEENNILKFCYNDDTNETLIIKDCKEDGMVCGSLYGYHSCIEQSTSTSDNCGSIDQYGTCSDDNILQYCDINGSSKKLVTYDCKQDNKVCGDEGDGYKYCLPPCGGIDNNGICTENNVLKYCKTNGTSSYLVTNDCKKSNKVCGERKNGKKDCLTPCGEIDEIGICTDDNILKYCVFNGATSYLVTNDCKEENKVCGDDRDLYKTCVRPDECGYIDEYGICTTKTEVTYCDNGHLKSYSCELQCIETDRRADCFEDCGAITEKGKCLDNNNTYAYCDPDFGYKEIYCPDEGKKCQMNGEYASCR